MRILIVDDDLNNLNLLDGVLSLEGHEVIRFLDGTGYPGRLKEEGIPLAARIVALSDVLDALLSKRPYKRAFPWEQAMAALQEEKGTHLDPDIVSALYKTIDEAKLIYEQNNI